MPCTRCPQSCKSTITLSSYGNIMMGRSAIACAQLVGLPTSPVRRHRIASIVSLRGRGFRIHVFALTPFSVHIRFVHKCLPGASDVICVPLLSYLSMGVQAVLSWPVSWQAILDDFFSAQFSSDATDVQQKVVSMRQYRQL